VGVDAAWRRAEVVAAEAIAARHSQGNSPIIVGLSGPQGSGKSTMAPRIAALLERGELRAGVLALDDFYLPAEARRELAATVHPLLATRGVPGTHELELLQATLDALLTGDASEILVPRFDKLADDRLPPVGWARILCPVDVVLLEGWCIGARPQCSAALKKPVNALEREEDRDGRWRRWVNTQLAKRYTPLFDRLALRMYLRAPSFDVVHTWRRQQEAALAEAAGRGAMNDVELGLFIAHYERITCSMLAERPADLVIELDSSRTPRV
jgi:D-glycerate 3-kinase